MKFAIMSSSCILQQPINQHCKTTYPFTLNELLKINTTIFFFFFLHFSKTMPKLCLLGLGRADCYCFTLRAVPGDSVSELAWLQEHSHSKQVLLRFPTCALPWGAASSELNPRHSTLLLVMKQLHPEHRSSHAV